MINKKGRIFLRDPTPLSSRSSRRTYPLTCLPTFSA